MRVRVLALVIVAASTGAVAAFAAGFQAGDPIVGTWNRGERRIEVAQVGPGSFAGTRLYAVTDGPCTSPAGAKLWELRLRDDGTYAGTNFGVRWDSSDPSTCRPLPIPATFELADEDGDVLRLTVCLAATDVTTAQCSEWTRRVPPPTPVPIETVANGCGGGEWKPFLRLQNYLGNTSVYKNSNVNPLARSYRVDFKPACDLHDAGYAGAVVRDAIRGGVRDFRRWSRRQVDDKFLADMRLLCRRQIPASATVALANCQSRGGNASVGAESRYNVVRRHGWRFFDADLRRPGTQRTGPRAND